MKQNQPPSSSEDVSPSSAPDTSIPRDLPITNDSADKILKDLTRIINSSLSTDVRALRAMALMFSLIGLDESSGAEAIMGKYGIDQAGEVINMLRGRALGWAESANRIRTIARNLAVQEASLVQVPTNPMVVLA